MNMGIITADEFRQRLSPIMKALEADDLQYEANWGEGAKLVARGLEIASEADVIGLTKNRHVMAGLIYLTIQMHRYGIGERSNDVTKGILGKAWREKIMPFAGIEGL